MTSTGVRRAGVRPLAATALVALCLTTALTATGNRVAHALTARLGLLSQTPFDVPLDGNVTFVLELPANLDLAAYPEADLVLTAYRPAVTRQEVADAQLGTLPRSVDSVDLPLATLPQAIPGQVTASVLLESSARTSAALQLARPGLYPLLVEVQDGGEVLADVLTFVHRLPGPDDEEETPLPIAIAMTTTSAVMLDDEQRVVIDAAVTAELTHLADVLEASEVPIAVRVPPALLTAVAADGEEGAALAARLRAGLARQDVLSLPQYPLDPSAAAAAGQQALYTQWLRDGEDDLAAAVANPSLRTLGFMDAELSRAGAGLLRDLGARLIVTTPQRYDVLPATTGIFTDFSQLVQLQVADGVTLDATVVDRRLAPVLARNTFTPVLTGIYAVTDLLALRQEIVDRGGDPRRHGVTLGTPDLSLPDTNTFRAITTLLTGTAALSPVTLDTLGIRTDQFELPDRGEVIVGLPESTAGDLNARVELVKSLTQEAASTASMLPAVDSRRAQWQQRIGVLPTSALTDDQVAGLAAGLRAELAAVRASIGVPTVFSFTLTGRRAEIPIKLYNNSSTPLTVRVHMTSSKLLFPGGDLIEELPPLSFKEVRVQIEARTNGRFPVTLQVLTPDATTQLAPAVTLTASVNALSGLGNLVTGALLLVVLTWWVRLLRRNRRTRAATNAAARHPATLGDGTVAATDDNSSVDDTGLSPDAATSTLPPS